MTATVLRRPVLPPSRPLTRSEIMSRIRGRDTKPEIAIRRLLFASGWRFRVHYRTPGGLVDVAFPKLKVAIQIDGCFWHCCPSHGVMPKSNRSFWSEKLAQNKLRDKRQQRVLKALGWQLLRIWEHSVEEELSRTVESIVSVLRRKSRSRTNRTRL